MCRKRKTIHILKKYPLKKSQKKNAENKSHCKRREKRFLKHVYFHQFNFLR